LKIVWSPESDEDLLQIWSYLASETSVAVADEQIQKIEHACRKLSDWPLSGRSRDLIFPGIRSIMASPHLIFYRVTDEAVQIVRVLHGRRDFEAVFNETT